MDYKTLLAKYLALIGEQEGTYFVNSTLVGQQPSTRLQPFTDEDVTALSRLIRMSNDDFDIIA